MGKGLNAASGLMAINDIARTFGTLFDDAGLKNSAKYDLMFILTPGAGVNYEATNTFLDALSAKISERIQFVLCLDHLANDAPLTLHVGSTSGEEQESFAKSTLKLMKQVASLTNTQISFAKKFTSGNFYEFEHLRYSEHGLVAATLTSLTQKKFSHQFEKSSIFDKKSSFNKEAYANNVAFISEFLFRVVFGFDEQVNYIAGSQTIVQEDLLDHLLDLFSQHARIPIQMVSDSPMTKEIKQLFTASVNNVKTKKVKLTNTKFFVDKESKFTLKAFATENQFTDIILFLSIAAYLGALSFILPKL